MSASRTVEIRSEPITPHGVCRSPRVEPLSLRRNFSWILVGNVVNAGCQWGLIVILAKWGTAALVGQFVLGLAVVTPIFLFSELQLRSLQATDARGECEFGHYLALRLITVLLAMLTIVALTLAFGREGQAAWIILGVGAAKAFESASDVLFGFFQNQRRMNHIGLSFCLRGFFSLLVFGATVAVSGSLPAGVLGLVAVRAAVLLAHDLPCAVRLSADRTDRRVLRPRWDVGVLRALAWRALPLGVVMFLGGLNTQIPRYFVEWRWGEESLGIFASIAYFATVGTVFLGALGQAASPVLARHFAAGDEMAFHRLLRRMLLVNGLLGLACLVGILLGGREILSLCYRPEYARHTDVFVLLGVAMLLMFLATPLGHAATASRRIRRQPVALAAVLLVSLPAAYFLVSEYALRGAACAVIVNSAAMLIACRLVLPLRGRWT